MNSDAAVTTRTITFAYPDREHKQLSERIEDAVLRVLRGGKYILGEPVRAFENALCAFSGAGHAIGVSCGTDALVCALLALDIGPGDEVMVPAFGFVAAAEAVVRVGARPVFVDIESCTLGPDPQRIAESMTAKTSAVIVMHLFGQAVDLQPIERAAPGLTIIDDAAQAVGTLIHGKHAGAYGKLATLSFFPAKSLGAAGDAGAILTCDKHIAERCRQARVHGAPSPYRWNRPGGNYRMDALQAAILQAKLEALPYRLAKRIAMANELEQIIAPYKVQLMRGCQQCQPTFSPFAIRLVQRDALMAQLRASGIDVRVHYPVTISQSERFARFQRNCPEAQSATKQLLSIPCCPEFTVQEWQHLKHSLATALEQLER